MDDSVCNLGGTTELFKPSSLIFIRTGAFLFSAAGFALQMYRMNFLFRGVNNNGMDWLE